MPDLLAPFRRFYRQWYTQQEWSDLEEALQNPPPKIKHVFSFTNKEYVLDRASLLPVQYLDPQPGEKILDLCAAPGGKSLLIVDAMKSKGVLHCNDASKIRLQKMKGLFRDYNVSMNGEGWELCFFHGSGRARAARSGPLYDGILVDAPCSSESHVLRNLRELKKWSPSRSVLLAKRQKKLLWAALRACRPGGRVVYATCSISPLENGAVVKGVMDKVGPAVTLLEERLILPHREAMGPLFAALLKRNH